MGNLEEIKHDRQKVYGDPYENHKGIGLAWAGLLQPHWKQIKAMEGLPAHVVALMMGALKMNRMRRVYHADNFHDLAVYLGFAAKWQKAHDEQPKNERLKVYVAGPYSASTEDLVEMNVRIAARNAAAVMAKGHMAHCPHSATHSVAVIRPDAYEAWMDLDFSIIRDWATALFRYAPSPGADREADLARSLGIPVYTDIDDIPTYAP